MNQLEESVTILCRKCCFPLVSPLRETKTEELLHESLQ
uniref:Uncharacterized protein n=1 Tax=Arundo donax TaxID=35708 RepID=A0A0A9GD93_ARUDO